MADAGTQTQAKSICQSWNCGAMFDGLDKYCPECGNRAVPQKRLKRMGAMQIVCGVLITVLIGAVSFATVPVILTERAAGNPELGGATGLMIIGLFAMLILFGIGAMLAGWSQMRSGRQNWRLLFGLFGIIAIICFAAYGVELGLIG